MCGVWVALEDITPENGAVFYYPKSQNLPEYNFSHFKSTPLDTAYSDYIEYEDFIEKIVEAYQFEKKPFYAKKGDVLIWSSNIIHGGSKVLNEQASRYSMVTHYYFKDCIYYTPMLSNMVTNELFLRNNLIDIKTGNKVDQSFNGYPINTYKTAEDKFILNDRLTNSVVYNPPSKKSKSDHFLTRLGLKK
jgi:ectoine hydroxylase-related dioxygenase (phytanoyl-CoA dioxygenase family)